MAKYLIQEPTTNPNSAYRDRLLISASSAWKIPVDTFPGPATVPYSPVDGKMADKLQLSLMPTRKTTFRMPVDLHRRLKITSVQENRQMADIVVDAIETYLSNNRVTLPKISRKR